MRLIVPILILPFALTACDVQTNDDNGSNVHINLSGSESGSDKVALNVPGFNASLSLPNLNLGAHMDVDGVKLAPDTKVTTMDVQGHEDGNSKGDQDGSVRMSFSNPRDPAKVIDYYKNALGGADYKITASDGRSLTATRDKKTFALSLTPDGSGSRGTITVSGGG